MEKEISIHSVAFEANLKEKIKEIAINERRSFSKTVIVLCEEALRIREANTKK